MVNVILLCSVTVERSPDLYSLSPTLQGIPGGGTLTNKDDLIQIVTSIIYTCSISHASANFPQYEEYGFPPNYPGLLRGTPPNSKV